MPASASNFLREIIPGFDRLAILFDTTYPAGTREADNVQRSAHTSVPAGVQRAADIPAAFDAVKGQIDAGYVERPPYWTAIAPRSSTSRSPPSCR